MNSGHECCLILSVSLFLAPIQKRLKHSAYETFCLQARILNQVNEAILLPHRQSLILSMLTWSLADHLLFLLHALDSLFAMVKNLHSIALGSRSIRFTWEPR